MVVGVAQYCTVFLATTQYSLGHQKRNTTEQSDQAKTIYAGQLLYIICVGLTRCSTSFFLSGLSREKTQRLTGICLAVVSAAWTVASVVVIAVSGDISAPWTATKPPVSVDLSLSQAQLLTLCSS